MSDQEQCCAKSPDCLEQGDNQATKSDERETRDGEKRVASEEEEEDDEDDEEEEEEDDGKQDEAQQRRQDRQKSLGADAPKSPGSRQRDSNGTLIDATGDSFNQQQQQQQQQAGQRTTTAAASPVNSSCRYRPQKYCAVCGDKAIACNFNAVTCESCKAFFRRNAFKEQRLKCLFDNRCIIDRVTRRFCSKCRLLKCFQIGMKREWILTDEQKQIKRVKIMQNKRCKSIQSDEDHDNRASLSPTNQQLQDAATSCSDEHERFYCSFASQCQYCSLRLAGVDHDNHHNQQQQHHHYHHRRHQIQVARLHQHFSPSSGGGGAVASGIAGQPHLTATSAVYPISSGVEGEQSANLHNLHSSTGAARMVGITGPALSCCCLDANNALMGQSAPQLHVMTPTQAPMSVLHLVSPDGMSSYFGPQHLPSSGSPGGDFNVQTSKYHSQHAFATQQAKDLDPSAAVTLMDMRQLSADSLQASNQVSCQSTATTASQSGDESSKSESGLCRAEPGEQEQQQLNRLSSADEPSSDWISKLSSQSDGQMIVDGLEQASNEPALVASQQTAEFVGDQSTQPGYIVWNGELYSEPAFTELELKVRLERLVFLESERILIEETVEATKFMFESSHEHKCQTSLNDIVQFCDAALRRLIQTVKQIKAFRMLNMDDQIILLKAACFKILLLRSTHHYSDNVEGWIDIKTGKIMRLDILKRAKKSLVYDRHSELVKKIPEPLRKDRLIMSIMSMALLFDPNIDLKHSNSVSLDNTMYLITLRKYLILTQPDPLSKYESLVSALKVINSCNEEYNNFFSKDFQPEQITPLLIEIFDISTAQ